MFSVIPMPKPSSRKIRNLPEHPQHLRGRVDGNPVRRRARAWRDGCWLGSSRFRHRRRWYRFSWRHSDSTAELRHFEHLRTLETARSAILHRLGRSRFRRGRSGCSSARPRGSTPGPCAAASRVSFGASSPRSVARRRSCASALRSAVEKASPSNVDEQRTGRVRRIGAICPTSSKAIRTSRIVSTATTTAKTISPARRAIATAPASPAETRRRP